MMGLFVSLIVGVFSFSSPVLKTSFSEFIDDSKYVDFYVEVTSEIPPFFSVVSGLLDTAELTDLVLPCDDQNPAFVRISGSRLYVLMQSSDSGARAYPCQGLYISELDKRNGQNFVVSQYYISQGSWLDVHEHPDDGILLYLAHNDFSILNVTDLSNITTLSTVDSVVSNSLSCDFNGNYCYVTEDTDRLRVVDVSDKRNPVQVGTFEDTSNCRYGSAYCEGEILIMNEFTNGFQVLNVSNKFNPVQLSNDTDPGGTVGRVWCQGHFLYVSITVGGSDHRLKMYNISIPTSPEEVREYKCSSDCGTIHDFHIDHQADKILVIGEKGMEYFTYSTASSIDGFVNYGNREFLIGAISDQWYVIGGSDYGIFGYNATDLTKIQESTSKVDRYWNTWTKDDGGNCVLEHYMINFHRYGFRIIDISDRYSDPKVVHNEDIAGLTQAIDIGCAVNLIYLVTNGKLYIYNVSDVYSPKLVSKLSYSGDNLHYGHDMAFFSDDGYPTIMYIGSDTGYWTFNLSDPNNPSVAKKNSDVSGYKSGQWIQRENSSFGYWMGLFYKSSSDKRIRVFTMTTNIDGIFSYESFSGADMGSLTQLNCHRPWGHICSLSGVNDGLQIYDTSDLTNITTMFYRDFGVDNLCAPGNLIWKKKKGNSYRLLVACYHTIGFDMYDFTPPDTLVRIDTRAGDPSLDNAYKLYIDDEYVTVSDSDFGIVTYRWNKLLHISGTAFEYTNCTKQIPIQFKAVNQYGNTSTGFSVFIISNSSIWCSDRGVCGDSNNCICNSGYFGIDCSISGCFGVFSNQTSEVCNSHGTCIDMNVCQCHEKYYGEKCNITTCKGVISNDTKNICSGHGTCETFENCTCFSNYTAKYCDRWDCFNYDFDDDDSCSGHGKCVSLDKCECDSPEYSGQKCHLWKCNNISAWDVNKVCHDGNGVCVSSGICLCKAGYSSESLQKPCNIWFCGNLRQDNPSVCNRRGPCVQSHVCQCGEFKGLQCETWSCGYDKDSTLTCSGNGKCIGPNDCDCKEGFVGDLCEKNTLLLSVMMPILIVGGLSGVMFGLFIICCLICCICEFILLCLLSVSVLICAMFSLLVRVRRFKRLKNFDLLLREQEMEDDVSMPHLRINSRFFEIPFEEVKTVSILGEGGSNSVVFKARWRGRYVAFKCFKTRSLMSSQDKFDEFEREVDILSSLAHPNIIRFFGATMKTPRVGIVMEFASNGEILDFIEKFKSLSGASYPLFQKARLLAEVSKAMEYLHSRNILHRDLKAENVLVDAKEETKLMDFGLSRFVQRMSAAKTTRIGTNVYMAPEILTESHYSEKCDVFSFAILIFVVFSESNRPYGTYDEFNIEIRVANDPSFRPDVEVLEEFIENSRDFDWIKQLMEESWNHSPKKRPSFEQISSILDAKSSKLKEESEDQQRPDGREESSRSSFVGSISQERVSEEGRKVYLKLSKEELITKLEESRREIQFLKDKMEKTEKKD